MSFVALVGAAGRLRVELAETLRALGWGVLQVDRERESFEAVVADALRVALVETGGSSGLAWIRELSQRRPPIAVIAIGGGPDPDWIAEARRAGAVACLRKPFRLSSLESTLSAAARGASLAGWGAASTRSDTMRAFLSSLRDAASVDATVLLVGEVGTGKRTYARLLHRWSGRPGPLVETPCATLVDVSELDAAGEGGGAAAGTRVLHRVGELSAPLQLALLRHLESREHAPPDAHPRLVVTACRPLGEEVAAGRLGAALRHRLDVVALRVPPLRERAEDIPPLAASLLEELAAEQGTAPPRLSPRAAAELAGHRFAGNVRELRNLMRRAVLLQPGAELDVAWLLGRGERAHRVGASLDLDTLNLRELERRAVIRSLAEHAGNRTRASQELGISVRTLRNKIREYGLR